MVQRSALLLGATGLVGGFCIEALLRSSVYKRVTVFTRRSTGIRHDKLEERIVDFDRLEDVNGGHVDDVFCCLGTTIGKAGSQEAFRQVDVVYPYTAALYARRHGAVQYLLVSAVGADPQSRVFYNRAKGEAEAAVTSVGFDAVRIFRPSLLLGERRESRPMERLAVVAAPLLSLVLVGPLKRYRPVSARDVARVMVAAAQERSPGVRVYESDDIIERARALG